MQTRSILDAIPALVAYVDKSLYTRFLNRAFAEWYGQPVERLQDRHASEVLGDEDYASVLPYFQKALAGIEQKYERTIRLSAMTVRHVIASYVPHFNDAGEVIGFFALVSDVSELQEVRLELERYRLHLEDIVYERTRELVQSNAALETEIVMRRRAEALLDAEKRMMEMICAGVGLQCVLETLSGTIEKFSHDALVSIQIADKDERHLLRDVASSLPESFAKAIREAPIAMDSGSSGSAAYLKQQINTHDIATDPKWTRYREAALEHGIQSCFSTPIISNAGRVLGTITLYYRTKQSAPEADHALVERATHMATIAFERDQVEIQLNYLATHDPLTHLPNRHLFEINLNKAIAQSQQSNSMFALMFIDLDRFKNVNDELGHNFGDELLKHVAKRLIGTVRSSDTVGRLGGDEFTVILENIEHPRDAEIIAEKLVQILSSRFQIEGNDVFISCSIGISIYPTHARDCQNLLKNADTAMYKAKNVGRNNFQMFLPASKDAIIFPVDLKRDLQVALGLNQFTLHYQPQFDAVTSDISSIEALLRWEHPELGTLFPSQFLPFAEESGLIVAIGRWVIECACTQNKQWHDAGFHTRVAINMSSIQIKDPELPDFVNDTLQRVGLPAQFLELELSEKVVTKYDQHAFDNLSRLKKSGVHMTVDDFGTGYSSLGYFKGLPIDSLKIDPSFTQHSTTDQDSGNIMTALLALATSLKATVTVQGIETSDQMEFLSSQSPLHFQGYALCKPLTSDDLTALLESSRKTGSHRVV
jgi:diguanylate cyclase (GGDEF)-like protein/PAS domain S-box-containing protein